MSGAGGLRVTGRGGSLRLRLPSPSPTPPPSVSSFVFGLAVALYYSWQLALLIIAIVPVMAGALGLVAGLLQKANDLSAAAYGAAGGTGESGIAFFAGTRAKRVAGRQADVSCA